MNPKAKIAIPAIVALIFIVIDFVAPVQYLSYFHTVFNFATRQTNPISLMLARITYIIFLCYLFAAVSGLLRGFRPRLRWGLSILSVVGLTSALTELSVMISISQAVNFTTLILNIMIVAFFLHFSFGFVLRKSLTSVRLILRRKRLLLLQCLLLLRAQRLLL